MPIPGTTKLHRLEEGLVAAEADLTKADLAQIESVAAEIEVEGASYPTTGFASSRQRGNPVT